MSTLIDEADDEIRLLVQELANVKESMREASRQLLRIERRIAAAFPGAVTRTSRKSSVRNKPRLDEAKAEELIRILKGKIEKGEQIERELGQYSVKPELQIVARILGLTNVKLPPKDELVRRISTRLRQSVSVSTGFHEEPRPFRNVTG
jgi:hypothetical protein